MRPRTDKLTDKPGEEGFTLVEPDMECSTGRTLSWHLGRAVRGSLMDYAPVLELMEQKNDPRAHSLREKLTKDSDMIQLHPEHMGEIMSQLAVFSVQLLSKDSQARSLRAWQAGVF